MKRITIIIMATLLVAMAAPLSAQTPPSIGYQGFLSDNEGAPVTGTEQLTFRLYESLAGGSAVWAESLTVAIDDGVFSVVLGNQIGLTIPFDRPYWLGITIEPEDEMTPRFPLTASPYSLGAMSLADSTVTTDAIVDGAVTEEKLASGLAVPPAGPAGGDLAGSYPAPMVSALNGQPVSPTAPTVGDLLKWSGSAWTSMSPSLPRGVIVMWGYSLSLIPDGWALCDGTNGTPNLMNVFDEEVYLRGVSTGGTPGTVAGGGDLPTHNHPFTIGPYETNPSSGHTEGWEAGGYLFVAYGHTHTVTITGISPDARNPKPVPKFRRVAFIVKL